MQVNIDPKILGRRLRYFRKRSGMSQFELEILIEASSGFISRIETGQVNPTKETVLKIAKVLNLGILEIEYLIGVLYMPATDDEIDLAKKELKDIFSKPNVFSYLIDDRLRLLDFSRGFVEFFNVSQNQANQLRGQLLYKVVFNENSFIFNKLDKNTLKDLIYNLNLKIYYENSFMQDDLLTLENLSFIKSHKILKKVWNEILLHKPPYIVHLNAQRKIVFSHNKKKIKAVYSLNQLPKYRRFQVVDFIFL